MRPVHIAVGRIPGTRQESAEYAKKLGAKATIAEAQALARSEVGVLLLAVRWAVGLAVAAVVLSLVTLVTVLVR